MVNHNRDLPQVVRSLGNFQNINLNQGDMNLPGEHLPELVDADGRDRLAAAERLAVGRRQRSDPLRTPHRISVLRVRSRPAPT